MTRRKGIFILLALMLVVSIITTYSLLPKRYSLGERLSEAGVFWNDNQAFFFLSATTSGRSANFLLDKLETTKHGYLAFFFGGGPRFLESNIIAYRLLPSGDLKELPLPAQSANYGNWTLQDGNLQLTPMGIGYNDRNGFRWDGEKFVATPLKPEAQTQATGISELSPDDAVDEDGSEAGFVTPSARKAFKAAGWHYKRLNGYETNGPQATLPIKLGRVSFDLTMATYPRPRSATRQFDFLAYGIKSLELSRSGQPKTIQTLWSQNGWQAVSKSEFERRAQLSGRTANSSIAFWVWIALFILLAIWKFGTWGYLLLSFAGIKRRVLNNMATSYAFPPATPSQFPLLDTVELDRYTREFDNLGFVRLLGGCPAFS